ncbi:MAG: recombinase family protein, partial [Dehalococcoidia bacterium]
AMSEYSSLKRQEEVCRNYIDIHAEKGWTAAGVFEDPGYSGKNFQRPGIQELLEDVRAGRIDVVVTYKIDRISRSLKDFYELWEILQAHNVTFVSATQHFDTSDSMGMLILNILLSFAQFERELTRERTMSKMAGRAEKGLWNGGWVPIGYTYDQATQTLTPHAADVPVIGFIYRRLIETRSPCTVANEANARGYRTKTRTVTRRDGRTQAIGGKRFDEDDIKAIVRNPVYKGVIRYNERFYPARHAAIIDAETWAQANQAIGAGREDNTSLRYKDDHVHLLKGILKCGVCGLAMTPYPSGKKTRVGTPYLYYACVNFTKDGSHTTCPIKMLPARDFEALIKEVLGDIGTNAAILQACVDAANREAVQSVTELEKRLLHHRDEVGRLTAAIRRIIEVMKEVDLLADDIKEEYKRLVREKERLQALCEKLEFDIERRQKRVLDVEVIQRSLQDFARLMTLLPLEDQKELFQLLLHEVELRPFDPAADEPPADQGAFTTRIRTRWYLVRIALYQLPGVTLVNRAAGSSENGPTGSPKRVIFRTASNSMLRFTLIAVGRESTVSVATVSPGMSHLNHPVQSLRGSAAVPIR